MHGHRVRGRIGAVLAGLGLLAVTFGVVVAPALPAGAVPPPSLTGRIVGWGTNDSSNDLLLGGAVGETALSPVLVPEGALAGKVVTQVSVGGRHACALSEGKAYCWGSDDRGALGNVGVLDHQPTPAPVDVSGVLAGKTLTEVQAGENENSCALDSDGQAYCWGSSNGQGALGDGYIEDRETPVKVVMTAVIGGSFTSISSGGSTSWCGLAGGRAYCWGDGYDGQMGNGRRDPDNPTPVPVDTTGALLGKSLTDIDGGDGHVCALDSEGHAYCWGDAAGGSRLGSGLAEGSLTPVAVDTSGVLVGKSLTAITAKHGGCAVDDGGKAYCWGQAKSEMGAGLADDAMALSPVAVDTSGVLAGKQLASIAELGNACALDTHGAAYCWGTSNGLGNGSPEPSLVPVAVDTSGVLNGYALSQLSVGNGVKLAVVGTPVSVPPPPPPIPPAVSIGDATVVEGDAGTSPVSVPVTLSASSASAVSVTYTITAKSAHAGSDFVATGPTVLTFAPGETAKTITIDVIGDRVAEKTKKLSVKLSAPVGATLADKAAAVTVLDNDAPLSLYVSDASVLEGNTGSANGAVFTVSLSAPVPAGVSVTAIAATADATAKSASDYTAVAPTGLTFTAGQQTKTVTVPVHGDTNIEKNETFTLKLTGSVGAKAGDASGLGTIVNDDGTPSATPLPAVSIGDAGVVEGDAGTSPVSVPVTLSAPSASVVSVTYAAGAGSAHLGTDFLASGPTVLTFAPGETAKTITIDVVGDRVAEKTEKFSLKLSAPVGASLADKAAAVTLLDNDAPLSLYVSDAWVQEGNSGAANVVVFTVSLSTPVPGGGSVTVSAATIDGTAKSASDYTAASTGLTFATGEQTKTVSVPVHGDTAIETNETLTLKLTGSVGAKAGDATGLGTIVNDD